MAKNQATTKFYSGQGIVMLSTRDTNGNPVGFRNVGNVSDLKISLKTSVVDHKESSTGQRGIDKRMTTEVGCDVSMTLDSFNKENLALALRGSITAVAAGTVATENLVAKTGLTLPLSKLGVNTVVLKKGADTLEEDKNYTINAETGSINFLTTADQTAAGALKIVADDDAIVASYKYDAQEVVESFTASDIELWVRFEGMNTAESNKAVVVDIFRFSANPLKELALINDKLGTIQLEGSAMADLKRTTGSQYFRETSLV